MSKKLLEYKTEETDLFYTREVAEEFSIDESTAGRYIAHTLDDFLESEEYIKEFINLQAQREGLHRTAILSAHGGSRNGKWYFRSDGGRPFVQDWINAMDGKYAALLLRACNTGSHHIFSRKSAVLTPNRTFSSLRQSIGDVRVELYIPTIRYVNGYTVDAQMKELMELAEESQK